MTPFFFGSRHRRLFGVYEPARDRLGATRAAVICHPHGDEQVYAYRTMRQLAARLTQAGFHTLRFDYYGTGDSAGSTSERDLGGWLGDIETAIAELKDMTGAPKVALVGLRFGANLLATAAARRGSDIESLVLWDPLVDGGEATGACVADAQLAAGSGARSEGMELSKRLAKGLATIDLSHVQSALSPRTLVLITTPMLQTDVFGSIAVEHLESEPAWIEDRVINGSVPVNVLQRIVTWLQ